MNRAQVPPLPVKAALRRCHGRLERPQFIEAAILKSLALIGYPATAGQISSYGYAMGGIRRDERNEALERLVAAGQVVLGEQPGKCRGPLRVHTVYSLARPGGGQ
jgi:hypothetical protein